MSSLLPQSLAGFETFGVDDDFNTYTSGGVWTTSSTNSGTVAVSSTQSGGINVLTCAGNANDEVYLYQTATIYKMTANQPIVAECVIQFSELATNNTAIMFGVVSGTVAGWLANTTTVPITSFTGGAFYKVHGTTNWRVGSSIGSTQYLRDLSTLSLNPGVSASGVVGQVTTDANPHRYRIEIVPTTSGNVEIRYFIDGGFVWKEAFAFTSPAAMRVMCGVKSVGANAEVLNVDRMRCLQRRATLTNLAL